MIVLAGATSFFVGTAFQAQMPEYAHHLGSDEAGVWYSVLFGANAAGAVMGALLLESSPPCRAARARPSSAPRSGARLMALFRYAQLPGGGDAPGAGRRLQHRLHVDGPGARAAPGPAPLRGRVVGLFNTAMLGLRAGSGVTVGVLGALISVDWSLALSAAAVVATSLALLAREARAAAPP